jgi:ribosomal protein L40E
MNEPHKVVLSYDTQYYVDVVSSYGSVSGSGWYDRDGSATITASSSSGTWPLVYAFTGWTVTPPSGKLTKTGDTWTLIVDRPYTVQAQWSMDVFPLLVLIGGISVVVVFAAVAAVAYKRGALTRRRPRQEPTKMKPSVPARMCPKCGSQLPSGAVFCSKCGTSFEAVARPITHPTPLEDKVYDYIVKHEGVISLSKASSDLGITSEELKQATEKLKKEGRLA